MFKKLLSLAMAVVLMFSFSVSALAVPSDTSTIFVDDKGIITERVTSIDSDGIPYTLTRETMPNGEAKLTLRKNGQETIRFGNVRYDMLYNFATMPEGSQFRAIDVHNSNFNHDFIGENTMTFTKEELAVSSAVLALAIGDYLGLTVTIAKSLAGVVSGMALNSKVDTLDISSEMYEVTFAHDNVYYCFCYHETVDTYNVIGSRIDTKSRTYQTIG